MHRNLTRLTAVICAAVFMLAACDDLDTGEPVDGATPPADSTPVEAGATAEATATPDPTPEPTPTPPPSFVVGDSVAVGDMEVTVIEVESDVTSDNQFIQPDDGHHYVAIDVEGCAVDEEASINPYDFRVAMDDNTRMRSAGGIREPRLSHTDLPVGDCIRGWVTFEVPDDGAIAGFTFEKFRTSVRWGVE